MEAWIWVLIPLFALMIPIVAIFSSHQQKMAQIIHRGNSPEELRGLRQEIQELKSLLHSQAIALDNLAGIHRAAVPPPVPELTERVSVDR